MRREPQKFTSIKKLWLISGILQLASGIIYIIGMETLFSFYKLITIGHTVTFWGNRIMSTGVLLPIICGALCVIGVIIGIKCLKKGEVIAPLKQMREPKIIPISTIKLNSQLPRTDEISSVNFCPECGYKQVMSSKFCTNCGFSLMLK